MEQSFPSSDFEVVIVHSGWEGSTREQEPDDFPLNLRLCYQPKPGAAAARNTGATISHGELLLFLDDDMIPSRDLLATHWKAYIRYNLPIAGQILSNISSKRGAYSNFLAATYRTHETQGNEGDVVSLGNFYTGNLSLPHRLFRLIGAFDEGFTTYGWEDTDLGYRLSKRGFNTISVPSAIAYHEVNTEFRDYLKKRYEAGRNLAYLLAKHPELEASLPGVYRDKFRGLASRILARLSSALIPLVERNRGNLPPIPGSVMFIRIHSNFRFWQGFRTGRQYFRSAPHRKL